MSAAGYTPLVRHDSPHEEPKTINSVPGIQQGANFLSLPPELKTYIYDLAGSVKVYQCRYCTLKRQAGTGPQPAPPEGCAGREEPASEPACFACFWLVKNLRYPANLQLEDNRFVWVNRSSHLALNVQEDEVKAAARDIEAAGKGLEYERDTEVIETAIKKLSEEYPTGTRKKLVRGDLRHPEFECRTYFWPAWLCKSVMSGVAQPTITKVNKEIRHETLSIFYGATTFILTLFDINVDAAAIVKWTETIGKDSAALLRDVRIVYRQKDHGRFITKTLIREMRELGVKTTNGVVRTFRLSYPFCYCEGCIRRAAGVIPDNSKAKQ